ncbi:MAG: lipid A biosynthesis acyltransferase [Bacteroidia bacterium]|nr:lipid A biosynthesis acyltransferase [Bacteroidia bacterium]
MSRWDGKTKGSLIGYKIFLFSIKTFGVSFSYLILHFVAWYYYFFLPKNRNALVGFYTTALNYGRKDANKISRKNFYKFGQTLIDRFAFLVGKGDKYTYTFEHEDYLVDMKNNGRGAILLSAHLGNWETAGNLLKKRISNKINVVMMDAEVEKIKDYVTTSTGGSLFNIIPIKDDLSHVILINNALSNNEFIAIHADRYLEGAKYIELDFLKKKAKFPLGPFIVASKFNAPVTFVYAIKESKYHYALSATLPITTKMSPEEIAKKYIEELEKKVKQHPEQWFNYFDFYK